MKIKVYTDGASKNNPGEAGAGAWAEKDGEVLFEISKYLGKQTNNFAEYSAVILALEKLDQLGYQGAQVSLYSDSQLLVNQLNGTWKVKNQNIKPLYEKSKKLSEKFSSLEFVHIPREKNQKADQLANEAIKNSKKTNE